MVRRSLTASRKGFWADIVDGVVEKALAEVDEWGLDSKVEDAGVRECKLEGSCGLLSPRAHARCLAAWRVFFSTWAIDSDKGNGVVVLVASSAVYGANWN